MGGIPLQVFHIFDEFPRKGKEKRKGHEREQKRRVAAGKPGGKIEQGGEESRGAKACYREISEQRKSFEPTIVDKKQQEYCRKKKLHGKRAKCDKHGSDTKPQEQSPFYLAGSDKSGRQRTLRLVDAVDREIDQIIVQVTEGGEEAEYNPIEPYSRELKLRATDPGGEIHGKSGNGYIAWPEHAEKWIHGRECRNVRVQWLSFPLEVPPKMIEAEGSPEETPGATPKRRHSRNRRVNAMDYWQKGVIDDTPVKERWSREFKDPRLKRIKHPADNLPEGLQVRGLVVEVHRRTCEVRLDGQELGVAPVTARYRATIIDELGEFPAVGDHVTLGRADAESEFMLLKLHPRQSALTRPGPRDRIHQQLTQAANVDQVVIVASVAQPSFNYGFADRFLLAASLSGLPMVMVLNKMDLVDQLPEAAQDFLDLVDRCIPISAQTGEGIDALQSILAHKISVFSGQSGVGKSTLINRLVPDAGLRTGGVREKDGKGRHTTTSVSLFDLPGGGMVIDTPGIRALGLLNLDPHDLARCFPGFFPQGRFTCRFNDCLHQSEPGCAVLEALEAGQLPFARYQSYLRILESGD